MLPFVSVDNKITVRVSACIFQVFDTHLTKALISINLPKINIILHTL